MDVFKQAIEYLSKLFQWWIIVMPWEVGVRVRLGNKIKIISGGTFFRIPFFDSIYIQTTRLRVVSMPLQTVTTKDGKTITVISVIGYSITDMLSLYQNLYQPESTISNLVLGDIADFVATNNIENCTPIEIEKSLQAKLATPNNYGIKYEYVKIIGYAIVRTYRLIQDQHWLPNNIDMNFKN